MSIYINFSSEIEFCTPEVNYLVKLVGYIRYETQVCTYI